MSPVLPTPTLVLFHSPCPDGFASAWVCWERWGDQCQYVPLNHGDDLPDVKGHDVWMLDLGLTLEQTELLASEAKSFHIIDHHASAKEELGHLPYAHFDLNHCGAVLTWKTVHPDRDIPKLLQILEVRDLNITQDIEGDALLHVLDSLPYSFQAWSNFNDRVEQDWDEVLKEGKAMQSKFDSLVLRLLPHAHPIEMLGQRGWAVNAPREFASSLAGCLAKDADFALSWFLDSKGRVHVSWRAVRGKNVIPLARAFGGGGHPTAAGARLSLTQLEKLLNSKILGNPLKVW